MRTSQTVAKLSDLRPSTRYFCQIRALSPCGWSRWSVPSTACTRAGKEEVLGAGSATVGSLEDSDGEMSSADVGQLNAKASGRLLEEDTAQSRTPAPPLRNGSAAGCFPSPPTTKGDSRQSTPRASPASCGWFGARNPWRVRQHLLHRLHAATDISAAAPLSSRTANTPQPRGLDA